MLFLPEFKLELLKPGAHVHFVGIGGISMSALAEILIKNGFVVSGSDIKESTLTNKLQKLGVKFFLGHSKENVTGADLLVYTAAVKASNPEIQAAKQLNIPFIERAVLLGEIMKKYQHAIAVAGTHGKTTTTSMISLILLHANLDPTILVGGELDAINGNIRVGNSTYFVTEACEYVESFLRFHPFVGIILNIEADHLDYFKDLNHIIQSFKKFAQLIPENGYIVTCGDDKNILSIINDIKCNVITYGIKDQTYDWKAENIVFNEYGFPSFDIIYKNNKISTIQLNIPGMHNVYNALAAAACAYTLDVKIEDIVNGLYIFKGTYRRFEIKGRLNGFTIVDDYAHHPTEIKATLAAASKFPHDKIWCVFQPHTYTRTLSLLDEFSEAFTDADRVIITDIYAARERDEHKVHSRDLVNKIIEKGGNAEYISSFDEITSHILNQANEGDLIITMGAGNIYQVSEKILQVGHLEYSATSINA